MRNRGAGRWRRTGTGYQSRHSRRRTRSPPGQRHGGQWEKRPYQSTKRAVVSPQRDANTTRRNSQRIPDITASLYAAPQPELEDISDHSITCCGTALEAPDEMPPAPDGSPIPDHCWVGEYLDEEEEKDTVPASPYDAVTRDVLHRKSIPNEASLLTASSNAPARMMGSSQYLDVHYKKRGKNQLSSYEKTKELTGILETSQLAALRSTMVDSLSANEALLKYDELCHALIETMEYRAELERKRNEIPVQIISKPPPAEVYDYGHGGKKKSSTDRGRKQPMKTLDVLEELTKIADKKQALPVPSSIRRETDGFGNINLHAKMKLEEYKRRFDKLAESIKPNESSLGDGDNMPSGKLSPSVEKTYRMVIPPSRSFEDREDHDHSKQHMPDYGAGKKYTRPTSSTFLHGASSSKEQDVNYIPMHHPPEYSKSNVTEKGYPITVLTTNYRQRQDSIKAEEEFAQVEDLNDKSLEETPIKIQERPLKIKPVFKKFRREGAKDLKDEIMVSASLHSQGSTYKGKFNDTRKVLLDEAKEPDTRRSTNVDLFPNSRIVVRNAAIDAPLARSRSSRTPESHSQFPEAQTNKHPAHFMKKNRKQDETENTDDGFPFFKNPEDDAYRRSDDSDEDRSSKRFTRSRSHSPGDRYRYISRRAHISPSPTRPNDDGHNCKILPPRKFKKNTKGAVPTMRKRERGNSNYKEDKFSVSQGYDGWDVGAEEGIVRNKKQRNRRSSSRLSSMSQEAHKSYSPEETRNYQTRMYDLERTQHTDSHEPPTRLVERPTHKDIAFDGGMDSYSDKVFRESPTPERWERIVQPSQKQGPRVPEGARSHRSSEGSRERHSELDLERRSSNESKDIPSLMGMKLNFSVKKVERDTVHGSKGNKKIESNKSLSSSSAVKKTIPREMLKVDVSPVLDRKPSSRPPLKRKILKGESSDSNTAVKKAYKGKWMDDYKSWFQRTLHQVLLDNEEAKELGLLDADEFLKSVTKGNRRSLSYIPRGEAAKEMLKYIALNKSSPISMEIVTLKKAEPQRQSDRNEEEYVNTKLQAGDEISRRIVVDKSRSATLKQDDLLFTIDRKPSILPNQVFEAKSFIADAVKSGVPKKADVRLESSQEEKIKIKKEVLPQSTSDIQPQPVLADPSSTRISRSTPNQQNKTKTAEFRSWQDALAFLDGDDGPDINHEGSFETPKEGLDVEKAPSHTPKSLEQAAVTKIQDKKMQPAVGTNSVNMPKLPDRSISTRQTTSKMADHQEGPSNQTTRKSIRHGNGASNMTPMKAANSNKPDSDPKRDMVEKALMKKAPQKPIQYDQDKAPVQAVKTIKPDSELRQDVAKKALMKKAPQKPMIFKTTGPNIDVPTCTDIPKNANSKKSPRNNDDNRTTAKNFQAKTSTNQMDTGVVATQRHRSSRRSSRSGSSSHKHDSTKEDPFTTSIMSSARSKPTENASHRSHKAGDSRLMKRKSSSGSNSSGRRREPSRRSTGHRDYPQVPQTPPALTAEQEKSLPAFKRQVEKTVLRNLNILYKFEKYRTSKINSTAKDILHAYRNTNTSLNFTIQHALYEIWCLFEDPTRDSMDDVKRQLRRVCLDKPCFTVDVEAFLLFQKTVFKLCNDNLNRNLSHSMQDKARARYVRTCSEYHFPQFDGEIHIMMKLWAWRERMHSIAQGGSFYKSEQRIKPFPDDHGNYQSMEDKLASWLSDVVKEPLYDCPEACSCNIIYEVKRQLMKRKAHATKQEAVLLITRTWTKNYFVKVQKSAQITPVTPSETKQESCDMEELMVLDEVYSDESDVEDDKEDMEIEVSDDLSNLASVQVIDLF